VTDLTAGDFKVADQGKSQTILLFRSPVAKNSAELGPHEYTNRPGGLMPHAVAILFDLLNEGDANRLGVIGFCRGGRNTWLYDAHNPGLKAAVVWYGPLGGPHTEIQPKTAADVAAAIHAPLLALQGGQDAAIRVDDLQAVAATARAAGRTVEVVVYPDAGHGFHADYRPSYKPADAADGWQRMLAWFRKYGVA